MRTTRARASPFQELAPGQARIMSIGSISVNFTSVRSPRATSNSNSRGLLIRACR